MRFVLVALLAAVLAGCAAGPHTAAADRRAPGVAKPAVGTAERSPQEESKPTVVPDFGVFGRVVRVNPVLRFVVMDFPVLRLPAIDQRLNVYRDGQKVGVIKVTGPTLETTIAGDIVTGHADVGDEVRED